jgi:CDP-paratose 2-epimerase
VTADIRTDRQLLAAEAAQCDVLLHLAAQVAVTTSVLDPRTDFEINAAGTFNVLEAARQSPRPPIVLYASTNKVYGGMENVGVVENGNRYGSGKPCKEKSDTSRFGTQSMGGQIDSLARKVENVSRSG